MLMFPAIALAQVLAALRSNPTGAIPDPRSPLLPTAEPKPNPLINTMFNFFPSVSTPPELETADLYWGDPINDDPSQLHRIYFQNLDGLRNAADEIEH